MNGNLTSLTTNLVWGELPPDQCDVVNFSHYTDVNMAARCLGAGDVTNKDVGFWKQWRDTQIKISKIAGAAFFKWRAQCSSWMAVSNWRYEDPFASPKPSKNASNPEEGLPAAPLLFLSTRYDPVTPLKNAREMSKNHPESGLLILEDVGHATIDRGNSSCMRDAVSTFFDLGVVPKGEKICDDTVSDPWGQPSSFSTEFMRLGLFTL
ncbi:hypothetical protein VHEMI05860 [[Torrubiella] hemipterigena]|uniref:Peptidase S33 tripeptidyl aminopeptidase-like C-terminal domain-containing protein n=1 Tax=[Torrubiella] hemipterigena TaxID=1531966 RepID=A0A0A1SZ02_9HYPO|nr:hypothetical protein VHEMI05860 [[Torrubiella] hemipterigena]